MSLNVALITETFERAKRENGGLRTLGLRFYERLFEKYPAVRPLFTTPPEEQHQKLMASVGAIVSSVARPEVMGIRHLEYRTEAGHYLAVGENLVAVLGEHLSAEGEWTPQMAEAWQAALKAVSAIMIEAAENPVAYTDELAGAGYRPDGFKTTDARPWLLQETRELAGAVNPSPAAGSAAKILKADDPAKGNVRFNQSGCQ